MHNSAFAELGMDAVYVAFLVNSNQVEEAMNGIRGLNIAGVNVTVPHKTAVIPFLDEITPTARRIGAVNTIRNDEGRLSGDNTDAAGVLRSLREWGFDPTGKTIGILGAGGAARALLAGFTEAGALTVMIANRTVSRAERLVQNYAEVISSVTLKAVSLESLLAMPLDLLVNTTTVGMKGGDSPCELDRAVEIRNVLDIIYSPGETALLKQAKLMNIPCLNGLGMLLYQGCEAFTFWTGLPAPVEVMRRTLNAKLKEA